MGCLWITSRPEPLSWDGCAVLQVSSLHEADRTVDPKRLQDLRTEARSFLEAHAGGFLVLDCLDCLTLHNGVERVVRAVETIHEDVMTLDATLVVFLDPQIANPRLVAWLERELDGLPTAVNRAVTPDVLFA